MNRMLPWNASLILISWIFLFQLSASAQLFVCDRVSNQILEYNLDGSFRRTLVQPSYPTMYAPAGMAFGNDHDLFVTSMGTGAVLRYDWTTGQYLGTLASGLYGPSGLLFDQSSNSLYVSEFGSSADGQEIIRYNAGTEAEIARFGSDAFGWGRADMAMGSDGKLYVSDWYDGQIMRFDPANSYAAEIFAGAGNLWGSNGIVFDRSGNLNVVGMMSNNVYQFNSSGAPVGELVPNPGGGLKYPSGIVIDPDGNFLVSSMGDDKAAPPTSGYIGKYQQTTGATINQNFITFSGSSLVQPTAMLIAPYSVWSGGAAGLSWKNAANWGGTAPAAPNAVRFGAAATGGHTSNNNDFDPGTKFNGITFASDAASYKLQGNAIKLTGPVVNQSALTQTINLDMELSQYGGQFDTGNQLLTINGVISGSSSLNKKGSGTLDLAGPLSYSGETHIDEGTILIRTPVAANSAVDLTSVTGPGNLQIGDALHHTTVAIDSMDIGILTIGPSSRVILTPVATGRSLSANDVQPVPEPSVTILLMAGSLSLIGYLLRRKN